MQLTYIFDPLCGWCYGAAAALDKIARLDGVTVDLAPSGLFSGAGARPMDEGFASYAWQNDQRIARLTGQVFSPVYRERVLGGAGNMFDSEPATLGVVAVALARPGGELEALNAIQRARYIDGRDNSDIAVIVDVLDKSGFEEAAARLRQPDETLLSACSDRIASARRLMTEFHAQGVPVLLVANEDRRRKLDSSLLYGEFDLLAAELQAP